MAALNGTDMSFYIDVSGAKTLIAKSTSNSIDIKVGSRDTTSKSSGGWKDIAAAMTEWSASGDMIFDQAAAYGFDDLFAIVQARALVTVRFSAQTSSVKYFEGQVLLTSLKADAPMEDTMTASFQFDGSGPLNYKALT